MMYNKDDVSTLICWMFLAGTIFGILVTILVDLVFV